MRLRLPFAITGIFVLLSSLTVTYAQEDTLLAAVNARPELSNLAAAIEAAGFNELLADPETRLTLFAPVNAAFDIPQDQMGAVMGDNSLLVQILSFHALPAALFLADLANGVPDMEMSMNPNAENQNLHVTTLGTGKTMINGSFVIEGDIRAGNSVLHLIDTVLVPPSLSGSVTSPRIRIAQNRELARMFVQDLVGAATPEARAEVANAIVPEGYIQNNPLVGQGRQGLLDFLNALPSSLTVTGLTLEDVIADESSATARWTLMGSHSGTFLGYEATNRDFTLGVIDIWSVQDGMVVEHWDEIGWLSFLLQVGVTEFPPPALVQ